MLFTVDLEDWFCNPKHSLSEWKKHRIRMETPTYRLLDMMDEHQAKGTFFILGWIAERKPQLIKEIHRRGHEIASHGYSHRLVYEQTPTDFQIDIRKSKLLLEQLTGSAVRGYRAPCFSMTDWGLDLLMEEGFAYDSSLMPNSLLPEHAKLNSNSSSFPFQIKKGLWEFPIPILRIGNWSIPCGGGGYFRLYPYHWFRHRMRTVQRRGEAFLFYIHPYDLDSGQPRASTGNWMEQFRRRYGLSDTENKLQRLLSENRWISIQQFKQRKGVYYNDITG